MEEEVMLALGLGVGAMKLTQLNNGEGGHSSWHNGWSKGRETDNVRQR